ncbi:hypothetical protein Tco_0450533 [Tanacetum coccineum]
MICYWDQNCITEEKWSNPSQRQRARVMIKAIDKKLIDRRLMRSLEKFVGGRPYRGDLLSWLLQDHSDSSYDINVVTTGKKNDGRYYKELNIVLEHAEFDESNTHVLERFYTSAGNPVKEILLKLNLPDHRKLKDGGEGTCFPLTHKIHSHMLIPDRQT